MAEKFFHAFQVDIQKLITKKEKEYLSDQWDSKVFIELLNSLSQRNPLDIRKTYSGWFMIIDEWFPKHVSNKVSSVQENPPKRKTDQENFDYIVGRFAYAEYGYVGDLRDVDTLVRRPNDKGIREGEEKFVYFYVRLSDGLLLLQGDMKVNRSKVEDYFSFIGKGFLQTKGFYDIAVRTLLRGDFLEEVKKLDAVNKIEVEIATEKPTSFENELLQETKKQALEFEANYATLSLSSKYKRGVEGMKNFESWLSKIKPKGTKAPVDGISNIKVIGKQDGDYKRVYLSKISEKYSVKVQLDDFNKIMSEKLYKAIHFVVVNRELLWRESVKECGEEA
ncbi:hypothetical protein SC22_15930 [Bacillus sp. A053]|uniref:Uncharacterized protein n=1 Tax=Bacillus stercoris TaxID=2054641 RepID=A0ABU0V7B5_9BACI|nr:MULTISPECIES: hypothetical protein [Bacillus]ASB60326.1 hypothetical protein CDO84_04760 [Bacillus sp. MD-5]KIH40137.1 hypothetical protein SC22_15930 [Bacillus sp. A053]MDQ1852836.1 hypothetical protein [Bacillus stercoris]